MNKNTFMALAVALMATPLAATAASVTYNFSGQVTQTDGNYSSVAAGTTITGTFNIDYDNAFAPFSSGTVGTAAGWTVFGVFAPVLSANIQVGDITYATAPNTNFGGQSSLTGGEQAGTGFSFNAQENFGVSATVTDSSGLQLIGPTPTYTADGQPVFAPGASATGFFSSFDSNAGLSSDVDFQITSFAPSPVPLPAALWLFVSGLTGIGLTRRGRRAHS